MFRGRAISCSRVKAVFGIQNAALPMIAAKDRSAIPLPAASHTVPKSGARRLPERDHQERETQTKIGAIGKQRDPPQQESAARYDIGHAEQSHYAEGRHWSQGCGGEPAQGHGYGEQPEKPDDDAKRNNVI